MKRFLLSLSILASVVLSCRNDQAPSSPVTLNKLFGGRTQAYITVSMKSVDQSKLNQLVLLQDVPAQKLLYSQALNQHERYILWIEKFSHYLENPNLGNEKKQLIIDLVNNLDPEFFGDKGKATQFLDGFMTTWRKKADPVFGLDQLNNLLGTFEAPKSGRTDGVLDDDDTFDPAHPVGGSQKGKPCNCGGSDGRLGRCGGSAGTGLNVCFSNGCDPAWWGCGDLFLDSCTGRCTYFIGR